MDQFIHQFELYRMANALNHKMQNPTARVAIFLSYINGEKVDDWAQAQARNLALQVWGNNTVAPTRAHDDEALWTQMITDFHLAFTHTTKEEDAFIQLQHLTMEGRTINEYNARFNHLIPQAGWERDTRGTIEMYKQGLLLNLHRAIY